MEPSTPKRSRLSMPAGRSPSSLAGCILISSTAHHPFALISNKFVTCSARHMAADGNPFSRRVLRDSSEMLKELWLGLLRAADRQSQRVRRHTPETHGMCRIWSIQNPVHARSIGPKELSRDIRSLNYARPPSPHHQRDSRGGKQRSITT